MPTGTFSSWVSGGGGGGGTSPGQQRDLTGSGPASQPRASTNTLLGPAPLGGQTMAMGSQTTPNYGYGAQPTPNRLNPNIGSWAMDAARDVASSRSNQLAQQAVGTSGSTLPLSVRSIIDSQYGPQSSLLDLVLGRQEARKGLITDDITARQNYLTDTTDLDRQGLAIDRKALGIDSNLTKGQLANLDRLLGILGQQFGLEGEALKNQLAQLGIDEAKLRDMAKRQTFDLRSNLTARGAFSTVANERGTGRINRDLMYGLGGINNQRTAADIQHRGNLLGLQEKGIGYDNQGLGLRARLANNGLDLERIGLNEERLELGLTEGLRQIGLEGFISLDNLADAIGGTNTQQAQLATNVFNMIQEAVNAGLIPGLTPAQMNEIMRSLGLPTGPQTPVAPAGSADSTRNL